MAISSRSKLLISHSIVSRFQTLFYHLHRLNHSFARDGEKPNNFFSDVITKSRCYDMSTWKVVDSRAFGIDFHKISPSSLAILTVLRTRGFQAYLVGGCVRDLLLDRIPKDFDVITDAKLTEIEQYFRRAWIVGREFPICQVYMKGSVVEVSSFDTVARHCQDKEKVSFSQRPTGCDEKEFVRWRNCLDRDFTINSLFYDPSVNKIYDYANGMEDLKSFKVRTVVPAHMSFREDCARILRGIRIAARLGLSFSEETASAIHDLYLSIEELNKTRLMREMNFMFSYGAAASSLYLLKRFKVLDLLLPFHAAYLNEQAYDHKITQNPIMLFELFSSMDKLFGCDRPSENSLWVALMAFHLALLNNPQDPLVIWAFSSLLYNGSWEEAVKIAREKAKMSVIYSPEILESCCSKSDEELMEDVTHIVSLVKSSIAAMTQPDSLLQLMARYPSFPCSGLVFISKLTGRRAVKLFDVLPWIAKFTQRKRFWINNNLLEKGDLNESRFVLGKVIMDTMDRGVVREPRQNMPKVVDVSPKSYHSERQEVVDKENYHCQAYNTLEQKLAKEERHHLPSSNTGLREGWKECHKSEDKQVIKETHLGQRKVVGKPHKPQVQLVIKNEKRHLAESNQENKVSGKHHKLYPKFVKEEIDISVANQEQEQQENDTHHKPHQQVADQNFQSNLTGSNLVQQWEADKKGRKSHHQQVSKEKYCTPESNLKQQPVEDNRKQQPVKDEKHSQPRLSSFFM